MKIDKLKVGTKLMWDASPNCYVNEPDKLIIYPAIVSDTNPPNKMSLVKIKTSSYQANWMGPEQQYLRLPTEKELKTLIWPEI